MIRDQASMLIHCSVPEVFAVLPHLDTSEGRRFGERRQIPEGPIRMGTRFEYQGKHLLKWMQGQGQVTEYVPNRQLTVEQTSAGCLSTRSIYRYTLESVGTNTRLSLSIELELGGLLKPLEWFLASVAAPTGDRLVELTLSQLKRTIEGQPARIALATEVAGSEEAGAEEQNDSVPAPAQASPSSEQDWIEQAAMQLVPGVTPTRLPGDRQGGWGFLLIYLLLALAVGSSTTAFVFTFLLISSPAPDLLALLLASIGSSLLVWLTGVLLRFWPGLAGRSRFLGRETRSLAKNLIALGVSTFLLSALWSWLLPGALWVNDTFVVIGAGVLVSLWRQRKAPKPTPTLFMGIPSPETETPRLSRRTMLAGLAGVGALGAGGYLIGRILPSILPPLYCYRGHKTGVESLAWSPSGQYIASSDLDGIVHVWEAMTGTQVVSYQPDAGYAYAVAWSPSGRQLASAYSDNTIHLWDAAAGTSMLVYGTPSEDNPGLVNTVAWSPDRTRLASGNDTKVDLWDPSTGALLATYGGHTSTVVKVAWSPDGTRLASTSADAHVVVWEIASGAALVTYRGHTAEVTDVTWSPDGTRIASAARDATAQIWEAATGTHLLTYRGPTAPLGALWSKLDPIPGFTDDVNAIAWASHGNHIAVGRFEGTDGVQVWDAGTGQTIFIYRGHTDYVSTVAWSPTGKLIASGSWDKTVQVWQLP